MKKLTLVRGSTAHRGIVAAAAVALAVALLAIPHQFPAFRVEQLTLVIVVAIAVLGLNLLTGYNGQISLGHSFFFAIGAYTVVVLVKDYEVHYLLALVPAFLLAFAAGFLFGIPALRLEGLYLALVTLALAVVTPPFIKRFGDITGGAAGTPVPRPTAPDWTGLAHDQWRYYVCLGVAALMFLIARNLVRGRVGRAVVAVRDNHIAAETMGVNLSIFKTLIFAYSAGFAGVAGGLFGLVVGFLSPESFTLLLSIEFLAGAVVGGLATITGPALGAFFTRFMPIWAADLNDSAPGVIYGVALILVMLVMPGGVMGVLRRLRALVVVIVPAPSKAGAAAAAAADTGDPMGLGAPAATPAADGQPVDREVGEPATRER
jgi:branched-chain amino acid transport system permease protein